MPIEPPRSPLVDLYYNSVNAGERTKDQEDMAEIQKESENRLIGSMGVQSVFLALAIMLYESWEWSQFAQVWQSAVFFGMLAFSFQAALYMVYRTIFEDSTNYRRQLRRMKNKNKRRMAKIKFDVEQQRTEWLFEQQMHQFQNAQAMANADGIISPEEQMMLNNMKNQVSQTAQQIDPNMNLDELARQLGLDRMTMGGLPIGPKLTVTQAPLGRFQSQHLGLEQNQQQPKNQ
jgi:hypothetical protein